MTPNEKMFGLLACLGFWLIDTMIFLYRSGSTPVYVTFSLFIIVICFIIYTYKPPTKFFNAEFWNEETKRWETYR